MLESSQEKTQVPTQSNKPAPQCSDEVKIEIIHAIKDVLFKLIDTLFPTKKA